MSELSQIENRPTANITETSRGYYSADSPGGHLSIGATNLYSLIRMLQRDGYAIGNIIRYSRPRPSNVFDPFSHVVQ